MIKKRQYKGIEIVEAGRLYLGAPYLWGGKSIWGIDCSGLTQMAYRFCGLNLPRDANQQEKMGKEVDFDQRQAGDLAFFTNAEGNVTHVAIVMAAGLVLHCSGHVKEENLEKAGIMNEENSIISHQLFKIKRYI